VVDCTNYYYYNSFDQYKCTQLPQCPDEFSLLVKEKRKCVNDCTKETTYRYQYNGECLDGCPNGTTSENYICKILKTSSCTKSSTEFELYNFLKEGGVEKIAKTYAKEFNYTRNHIALFKNDVYSIILYKNRECINELGLGMPDIDFGDCYKRVQAKYVLANKDLVVAIIDKKSNKNSNPITSYAFYNPENGEKLNAEEACKETVITVKENIKTLLNDSVSDLDSLLFLTGQNINVFNKSSEFYTSLCYHFDSPCDKDVALRDRLLIYYPNITLCDLGCTNTGVNLTAMIAICECKYKDLTEEDSEGEDNLYKAAVNQFNNILNQVNLLVMECYEDLFEYKYFISNTGGHILLFLISVGLVNVTIYYFSSSFLINKYIYSITENYLLYLNKSPLLNINIINYQNNNDNNNENGNNSKRKINYPPKKISTNKNDIIETNKKKNNKKNNITLKSQDNSEKKNMLKSPFEKMKKHKKHIKKGYSSSKKITGKNNLSIKSNITSNINKSRDNLNNPFEV
jgi:hypothetical protein